MILAYPSAAYAALSSLQLPGVWVSHWCCSRCSSMTHLPSSDHIWARSREQRDCSRLIRSSAMKLDRLDVLDRPGTPCTLSIPTWRRRLKRYSARSIGSFSVVILVVVSIRVKSCLIYIGMKGTQPEKQYLLNINCPGQMTRRDSDLSRATLAQWVLLTLVWG